jgi:hypothetical protein
MGFMLAFMGIIEPLPLRAAWNISSSRVSESARMCTMGPVVLCSPSWGLEALSMFLLFSQSENFFTICR